MVSDNLSQDISIRGEGNIVVGKGDVIINPLPPAEARLRHDLGILMKNVETTWIKGVLEKSVHDAALLELGMEIREEAVDNPWRMVIEKPDQSREEIPKGRNIKDIFDEANRLLLILGEPGSGKTTTLLQLARDLIAEVDSSFSQPVPVILNLSTWVNKHQPLDEWLVLELSNKYKVPKKDGKKWLADRRILLLLDGLDEVKAENRSACVESINQLVSDFGLQGLVVCSRVKDYIELSVRLAFYRAIYIQPLTHQQVDKYLDNVGDRLASLRATLQVDEALRSMAQSPLILNIMNLAYQNTSADDLSNQTLTTDRARYKHLFDTYITRMFNRKVVAQEYDTKQTKQWLAWLARNMQLHNQEVFLVENLQPSWLHNRLWRLVYVIASRLLFGLIFGLMVRRENGLIQGLIYGLTVWLAVSSFDIYRLEWLDNWRDRKRVTNFWWSVINIVSIGLFFGLTDGLANGLLFGLFFGLRGSRRKWINDTQTIESLHWYWGKALKGGLRDGLIAGVIFGLFIGLSRGMKDGLSYGLVDGLSAAVTLGLIFAPMGAILNGLGYEIVETKSVTNQGMRLTIRNSIISGLFTFLLTGLIAWLIEGLFVGLSNGIIHGLEIGIGFGLIGTLWYGCFDVIQHYTLRLLLIIQGYTPHNFARFLDYAVNRIFLQKVGGGYRFIHRMLLEHFAETYEPEKGHG